MHSVLRGGLAAIALMSFAGGAKAQTLTPDTRGFYGFKRSLNTTTWGYKVVTVPAGAPSSVAERFEVRPGDCGSQPSWDDCATDRERSELSEIGQRSAVGSTYWYGFSLYLPPDFPSISPTKTILGQFHQEDSHVVFLFQMSNGSYWLDDQRTGQTAQLYQLISESELMGRWHRIWVNAKWAAGSSGYFRVYVNGTLKLTLNGGTAPAQGDIYLKYGVYRAFVSRYTALTGLAPPTQIAYFTRLRKGFSKGDVK